MLENFRVIIQRSSLPKEFATFDISRQDYLLKQQGFVLDETYEPVKLNYSQYKGSPSLDLDKREISYLVRGQVDSLFALKKLIKVVKEDKNSIAIFEDSPIAIKNHDECDNIAIGTSDDVRLLLRHNDLHVRNMMGFGVHVGIVDTGLNLSHLSSKGLNPNFDSLLSSTVNPDLTPGHALLDATSSLPVGHGTMCAFNVCSHLASALTGI